MSDGDQNLTGEQRRVLDAMEIMHAKRNLLEFQSTEMANIPRRLPTAHNAPNPNKPGLHNKGSASSNPDPLKRGVGKGTGLQNAPTMPPPPHQVDRNGEDTLNPNSAATPAPQLDDKEISIPQQQNLIRIMINMLQQQAQLCTQQANHLRHISQNIDDASKWKIFDNDTDDEHILSKEELMQKVEKEAVVKLAKSSYNGMRQLQKTMDAFLKAQNQRNHRQTGGGLAGEHMKRERDDLSSSDESQEIQPLQQRIIGGINSGGDVGISQPRRNVKRERDDSSSYESEDEHPSKEQRVTSSTPHSKLEGIQSSNDEDSDDNKESIFSSLDIQNMTPLNDSLFSSQTTKIKRERDDTSESEED